MVENSENSTKAEKRSTRKTSVPTREQSLEILQMCLKRCAEAGIKVQVAPVSKDGTIQTVIVLTGINVINGNLVDTSDKE